MDLIDVSHLKTLMIKMNRKNDQFKISTKHMLDALPVIGDYFVKIINGSFII